MIEYLIVTTILAAATAGAAIMARALPWPKEWIAKKPLACPVCMAGWSGFAVLFLANDALFFDWTFAKAAITWLVCVAVGATIFNNVYPPPLEFPSES